jgi:uncharacterized protein (TIGR00369 family)
LEQTDPRHVADSEVMLAQVMLPSDANPDGNVHGGTLMKLADTAGGTAAIRHARRRVVTVVMDSMTFLEPVYVGDLVLLHARVTWVGHTSIEVEVSIEAEDVARGERRQTSTAFFVYVALDESGRPHPMPPLELSSDDERRRWSAAEERRTHRLEQNGRKGPKDSHTSL